MRHLGDITKIDGHNVPSVDIVCGGSPCQDLSIAGKRKGLQGERSGLFMEQVRIIKEMRDECKKRLSMQGADVNVRDIKPRYMVWENVPGAFSSNKGEDFRCVLEETAKIVCESASVPRPEGGWTQSGCILGEGWSIAWRVHDAQFWGVPQRRKRISLVADFGGQSAPEILFERKSLFGDSEESRNEKQGTAQNAERCLEETRGTISFQERAGKPGGGKGILIQNERTGALSTLNNQNVVYGICSLNSNSMKSNNPHSGIYKANISRTLDLNGGNPACNQGGMVIVENDGNRPGHKSDGVNQSNVMPNSFAMQRIGEYIESETLSSLKQRDYKSATDLIVSYGLDRASFNQGINAKYDFSIEKEKSATQVAKGPGAVASFYPQMKAESQCFREDDISNTIVNGTNPGFQNGIVTSIVRRLTPLECERLQGYPDRWTDIGEWTDSKGKKHKDADSPRYKALGNSIALPFWEWMSKRMVNQLRNDGEEHPTMASLFDGIGGFPLVYSRADCQPIWASEIEDFPIAVTKIRFPDIKE